MLQRGGAPYLEVVFGRLAAHAKDIQRTGSIHAAPARRTCKDTPSARESPGVGSSQATPPRPSTTGAWAIPDREQACLQLASSGRPTQFPTWMPQIHCIPHPLDKNRSFSVSSSSKSLSRNATDKPRRPQSLPF